MKSSSRGEAVVRQKGDNRRAIRIVAAALFVLLIALPLSLWFVATQMSKASLRRSLAAIETSGEPLSSKAFEGEARTTPLSAELSDLLEDYREDPVLTYELSATTGRLVELGYSATETSTLEGLVNRIAQPGHYGKPPIEPDELRQVQEWLDDIEEPLELAIREQGALRFEGITEQRLGNITHFLKFAHHFGSALAARAHLQTQAGDSEGALKTLAIALRFAGALGPPTRFTGLLGAIFQRSTLESDLLLLEALLDKDPQVDARELLPLIPEGMIRERAIQALMEERARTLESLGRVENGKLTSTEGISAELSDGDIGTSWDLAIYLDVVAQTLEDLRSGSLGSSSTSPPALGLDLFRDYQGIPTQRISILPGEVRALEERILGVRKRIEAR